MHSDFQTGAPVNVQTSGNYDGYEEQQKKYPYLSYSWDLPSPVPADLLLSFDDFIHKHDIGDEVYNIFSAGRGFTNILDQLTINVMKMVDDSYFNSIAGAAIGPVSGKNDEIYSVAVGRLGSDALLSSTVTAAQRSTNLNQQVRLVVKTPSGNKLIQAKKLLITAPPLVSNCEHRISHRPGLNIADLFVSSATIRSRRQGNRTILPMELLQLLHHAP